MSNQKKYWKGLEELNESPAFIKARDKEFAKEVPIEEFLGRESITTSNTSRRDFLKYLGFTVAAASLAACEAPVVKSIPYLFKPEEVTPGIDNCYASTFFNGEDYCSVLIKTRDGRPIKIEGNPKSPVTKGAVNARVHASVLSLYDNNRAKTPYAHGGESTWDVVDKEIAAKLASAKNIAILSSTIISPSTHEVIAGFIEKYPATKHVMWDAVSFTGMRAANEMYFSKAGIPTYSFNNAKVIVSIAADFLTNWLSPIEFSKQYAATRKVNKEKPEMSKHYQFESIMTVSGANADCRIQIKPSEEGEVAMSLLMALSKFVGGTTTGTPISTPYDDQIKKIAEDLWANKGKSLVIAGSNDINVQAMINQINKALGNYGSTINMERTCNLRQGNDMEFASLVKDMSAGKVDVLITYNTNPLYNASSALGFKDAYAKVPCKISFATSVDETAGFADYICPDHHYLESWNDANPYTDSYSLAQPTISPLFTKKGKLDGTRCAQETLLKWAGSEVTDYHTYIQNYWKKNLLPEVSDEGGGYLFTNLWNETLQSGVFEKTGGTDGELANDKPLETASPYIPKNSSANTSGYEVVLYQKTSMGSGMQSNNPWLQELPDPISKVTWDNYITMNPGEMRDKGFSMLEDDNHVASMASLTIPGHDPIELPVFPQPGQTRGTLGVAIGYGRTNAGRVGNGIGKNVYPWVQWTNNTFQYYVTGAAIASANKTYEIGATQTHNTMIGRPILKETTLEEYIKKPDAGNEEEMITIVDSPTTKVKRSFKDVNLWDDYDKKSPVNLTNNADNLGLRWKMAIDLNSCIGCGACVVSCTAENNVPVVGKAEVILVREMHWIRIDRYYSSDMSWEKAKAEGITESNRQYDMMVPSNDNPEVAFQPIMCQHCNHAPCETVCPVIATSHSSEGINQMVYNRCVGTKYCANNCPYKVRRFNWFNYYRDEKFMEVNPANQDNELGRMVLNPDVVVRSRGVMEKCSFCLQRIQGGKLKAKLESREIKDGDIKPACAQSCPTEALVFGNSNDPDSKVAELMKNERNYLLLADLDTQPNVFYMTKIRNKDKAILE